MRTSAREAMLHEEAHLDHVVEYEVCEDGEGVGANLQGLVVQPGVHLGGPRLHRIGKPNGKTS